MSIGTYTPDTVTMGNVPSSVPNQNADPGSVNPPAVAEPSSAFTGGQAVLIVAASGASPTYGGCEVHLSFDGTNYSKIGTIESQAPQGVLTANLADHADPDTVDTLSVDCTQSFAPPPAGITNADADNDRTLSLVCAQPSAGVLDASGEFISFGAVAATGTYAANLAYLRRARMGSAHSAHASGDMFTVLDVLGETTGSLRYELPAQYIGQTLYLKLAAFNQFGNATQDLSFVTEYTYVPNGTGYGGGAGGVPAVPTGLAASAGVQQVALSWSANPATDNIVAYKVFRAAGTGASFGSAVLIATVNALAWLDPALGIATGYTYFLEAVNAVGASSLTSGVNATTSSTAIGTVTSVGLSLPPQFAVTGSPVIGSGTLTGAWNTQSANLVFAGPSTGSAAVPVFRSLVAADLPNTAVAPGSYTNTNLTVDAQGRITSATNGSGGGSGTVTTTGTPASGNLAKFSGATSITNGDLSGDVTTNGTLAATLAASGVSAGTYGDATHVAQITVDAKGRATTVASVAISGSGGGGGTGAWWNTAYALSSTFTHSFAASGNLIVPQQNMTIYEAAALLTTVNSATYKIGLAPFNTSTNEITALPTYTATVTIGSSAGAANQWVRGFISGGFAMSAGTTYLIFIVRTDAGTTPSTTLNTSTAAVFASPGIYQASTNQSRHLASVSPQLTDVWTVEGGFYDIDFAYQFN